MKPYPAYKDSGVEWLGDVPEGWVVVPLKRYLKHNDGGVWGDDPLGEGDTIVLRSTEQTEGGSWSIEDPAYRHLLENDRLKCVLRSGDILITKSSGSAKHIGKATLVDAYVEQLQCCYSNFMQRLRFSDIAEPKFCWYYLNSIVAREQFGFMSNSTTGLANLSAEIINQLITIFPPPPEQRAIAAFLDHETAKIDGLIEEQRRLIALLAEKRQATISHAVTKGLNPNAKLKPSGIDWLGDVPEGWEVVPLWAHFRATKGPRGQMLTKEYVALNEGIFPVYSGQTENNGVMGLISDYDFDSGENGLLFSTTVGAKAMTVSHIRGRFSLSQNCMIIAPSTGGVLTEFYSYHFTPLFSYFRKTIPEHMQASFRMADLYKFKLALPPINEQEEISKYLKTLDAEQDALIETATNAITLLQERRAALISAAVTGKIDVRGLAPSDDALKMEPA